MSPLFMVFTVASAVAILLFLTLKVKINAFISLLLTAIYVGVMTGMPFSEIIASIQNGMGGTLGFVATVVGLGAIFGQMLESSGGAQALAHSLVARFGKEKASWAMMATGFIVAIPVFLDVAFIILVPIVYALAKDAKKSLLYYGIPLLAGLAVTHSFVPPTPGPIAVADIIDVQLGWVIFFGFILGFPTAVIAGPFFGRYIAKKINIQAPALYAQDNEGVKDRSDLPSFAIISLIIGMPLILILVNTVVTTLVDRQTVESSLFTELLIFIGHPFSALILATLTAIYFLCLKRGMSRQAVLDLSTKALGPAGIIILITGAGGVLKQILIDSGIGKIMAESVAGSAMPVIALAWILSAIVRVTQGSATVAMITAAGIMAPVLEGLQLSQPHLALVVIAIASGATLLSHVNDSGFWLVSKYFGMNEKQTLQSWTVMETIIALCGLSFSLLASAFV